MKYFVDYNKAAEASTIQWDGDLDITECDPYIDFIRCDDGEDYQYLYPDKDFQVIKLIHFQAIPRDDEGEDLFLLCYVADLEIDLNKHQRFNQALENSDNLVEIVIGFKNNSEIVDCFEEYENRQAVLQKST